MHRSRPLDVHAPHRLAPRPALLAPCRLDEDMSHALDDAALSHFHKKLAILSSGGPFLDGYILSIIGVAMIQLTPELGLTANEQGLAGAAALIGIFFGAFLG